MTCWQKKWNTWITEWNRPSYIKLVWLMIHGKSRMTLLWMMNIVKTLKIARTTINNKGTIVLINISGSKLNLRKIISTLIYKHHHYTWTKSVLKWTKNPRSYEDTKVFNTWEEDIGWWRSNLNSWRYMTSEKRNKGEKTLKINAI